MIVDDNIIKQHGLVVAAVYAVIVATPTIKQAEIARECNISIKTAQRALETLQQVGYIRIKNNKPNSNTYEILYHAKQKTKKVFGAFGHVLLTEQEHLQLLKDFGADLTGDYIKKLDSYMEIHPEKHYKAHQQVLRDWIVEDENKLRAKNAPKGAKHWYGGKTYGELIRSLLDAQKRIEYLSILSDIQQHEVATMPLDDYVNAVKEQREYEMYAFREFLEGEE